MVSWSALTRTEGECEMSRTRREAPLPEEMQGQWVDSDDPSYVVEVRGGEVTYGGGRSEYDWKEVTRGEDDPTCSPYGGWERDRNFDGYSDLAKKYEIQIARAPGLDYVVRRPGQNAGRFDGCATWDPRHQLLEAKGPRYAGLIARAKRSTFYRLMSDGDVGQANRQAAAAGRQPVEWHVAEPGAFDHF